ncbi:MULTISPECIES: PBSX family phage terminase large subunit [Lactobacillaceae]|uniref:Phage terminase large subunit n=1 Tax=Lentilactobacillus rapi TaxID=481723 RepID=A0A512PLD0_9LACO|nr:MULTISPECIES: PBSX family phage terminase large subunit [Lactobacillaceae]GEP72019.1 phage terminase large subunit [Lentilactobacillus rapi]
MRVPQFQYSPFSIKQLQVLAWWLDPKVYDAGLSLDEVEQQHPEWLNREDKEAIICDGSIRAGKTLIMSMSYVLWSMTNYDQEQFGIAGKTIGSLRRNVITPLKRMLEGRGYKVHDKRADNLLEISYGSRINYFYLFGGKDESSQDLVQGVTAAGFFFDEVALMPESFVNQATGRVSVDGGKLWFNCNPDGPYHWFKLEWLDQLEKHRALHIHFIMDDNPSLSKAVKDRYYRSYSGVFYQRFILGLWVLANGIIYDNFDKNTMVVNDPPKQYSKYYVSCDYGTLNPTVFLLWGFSLGTWYLVKEYYYDGRANGQERQKSDDQYAHDMVDFLNGLKPTIIVDPSAASFITKLRQIGYHVVKANNDVLDGIRVMQSAMNTGKIKFTPNLPNVFKEFASYIWDDKAAERGEDKPVKQHDHSMDAGRYFCMYMFRPRATIASWKL